MSYISSLFLFHNCSLEYISSNTFNGHHGHFNIGLAFDCLVLSFSWVTVCNLWLKFVAAVLFFCFIVVCVLSLLVEKSVYFSYYYVSRIGETLSYNGLRQMGLITLKWSFLFEPFHVDSSQWISFGGSTAVYGSSAPWSRMLQFQSIQPTR